MGSRLRVADLLALAAVVLALAGTGAAAATQAEAGAFWELPDDLDIATRLLEAELRRDAAPAQQLMRDQSAAVRARATLAVGRIALPTSLPWLLEAVRDPEPAVRAAAAFALGLLDYGLDFDMADSTRQRAAAALLPMLDDANADVAAQAAAALGPLGVGAAELRVWLAAGVHPAAVTAAAISSWWRLSPGDASPLAPFVGAADAQVRLQTAHALRRSSDPDRGPLLRRLLEDTEVEVRIMALRGLSFAPARLAHELTPPFLQMGDWREQCEALAWLGTAWRAEKAADVDEAAFVQVVRRALDRNPHTRGCALRALGALGDHAVASDLLLEGLGDAELAVRLAAIESLAEMPARVQQAAVARLGDLAAMNDPLQAAASVPLLARAGRLDGAALQELAVTAEAPVAAAALAELERADPRTAWHSARLALGRDDGELTMSAAGALARLAAYQDGEQERAAAGDELWRVFADRSEAGVRAAAFDALVRLVPDLMARRRVLLQEIIDPALRRRAAGFLFGRSSAGGASREDVAALLLPAPADDGGLAVAARQLASRALALQRSPVTLRLETARGTALLRLRADLAPLTTLRMLQLVDSGELDAVRMHRVVPAFVVQGGPRSQMPWAAQPLPSEETPATVVAGTAGLATAGRDTGTSQFWIATAAQPHLQGTYPIFAEVVEGMRAVARIQRGDTARITRAEEAP